MDNFNPQNNWPAAIKRQAEAQAAREGSGIMGWVSCCTCRVVTISFMLYYLTLNVVILVLVFLNQNKIEEQPRFWWIVSLSGVVVNMFMSIFILVAILFADLSPDRGANEPDKTAKPIEDDHSGSQKTILTINSRPSTIAPTVSPNDLNAPPVIDQTTAAAAAAAANQTASQAIKSPALFPKLTITNPPQNFQNLTPNSTSVMQTNYAGSAKAKKSPKQTRSPTLGSNQKRVRSDSAHDAKAKKKLGTKQLAGKKKS